MRNKTKWTRRLTRPVLLALIMTALAASPALTLRAQTNSAENSQNSDTPATDEGLRRAAAEAVEELRAARVLLEKQGIQIEKQRELLQLEREISAKLKNLRTLDEDEKAELRRAIAAKDRVIGALEKENAVLRKKRFTLWKGIKVAAVAVAAGIIVGKVF
ncbi:MAG TPA: hypothetical protein VMM38_01380 [Aridibacter sp.]|nr:hypothetical protein [Aridibacter sp.]